MLPIPYSLLPRCAFRWRIKFATGRTAPYSLLPTPYSLPPVDTEHVLVSPSILAALGYY